jgi:hypothetical protein
MSDYGLLTGFWRCCRPKVPYYGAYPSGFLLKARRALAVPLSAPILHVCGGRSRDYSQPEFGITKGVAQRGFGKYDKTLDLDPALCPDFLRDARLPYPPAPFLCDLPEDEWDLLAPSWQGILIDRPYTDEDAKSYAPGVEAMPKLSELLKNAAAVIQSGRRVGVLDYLVPSPTGGLELVGLYGVMCGFNNRVRCFSVYEMPEK